MAGLDNKGLDSKISNIIGAKIPQWLMNQMSTRSDKTSLDNRDNDNILFLTNKTAWIRLVSSINIIDSIDRNYFNKLVGGSIIIKPEDLAKQFVLFGGTSKYLNKNSYQLRAGLGKDGSYGMLGENEINKYGYKPFPGITRVNIETQGKLGSVLSATVSFKCWDKDQLDIIDALYFKLGYTMFLEWGHTYYYLSPENKDKKNPNEIISTELMSIDPFQTGLKKEDIYYNIAKNRRESEGNYDAMFGLVTNFNFTYTQDGGYDCTLKLMSLGILGDSIKINNQGVLPGIVKQELIKLNNTLEVISTQDQQKAIALAAKEAADSAKQSAENKIDPILKNIGTKTIEQIISEFYNKPGLLFYPSDKSQDFKYADIQLNVPDFGDIYIIRKLNGYIPLRPDLLEETTISFDNQQMKYIIGLLSSKIRDDDNWLSSFFTLDFFLDAPDYPDYIDLNYTGFNNLPYSIIIKTSLSANPIPEKVELFRKKYQLLLKPKSITPNTFVDLLIANLSSGIQRIKIESYDDGSFTFSFSIFFNVVEQDISVEYKLPVKLKTNDTRLIKNFIANKSIQPLDFKSYEKNIQIQNQIQQPSPEEQKKSQEALNTQIENAINMQSSLELILRAIQFHSLNKAINQTTSPDLNLGRKVFKCELWKSNTKDPNNSKKPFLQQIFSSGVYSSFIQDLVDDKINISEYTDLDNVKTSFDKFKIRSVYGFATALMANTTSLDYIKSKKVNYKKLLNAYVIPYDINQEIVKGIQTNHPVYIQLGLLLMILNHSCTIYDTSSTENFQTPLVYIDYNPELNFCLSNTKHLSTNPWKTMIPFEGGLDDYKQLFDDESLKEIKLFNPEDDVISGLLPEIKFSTTNNKSDSNIYRAKMMNILINIDYAIQLVKDFSTQDGTNSVFLKPYIEQILSDLNKYLGNFNAFRLSYNDQGNTFQIIDDQFIPTISEEDQISPYNNTTLDKTNTTEIPLIGKTSIAKSLEITTDISSKLANMLAISANSNIANKATLSVNGDSFGFINTNYEDRYIQNRQEITGSTTTVIKNDTLITAAKQFNEAIIDLYSKYNPSENSVSQATNYYMEKMSKIKNNEPATRASTLIPVSINFSTDGISGLSMGHGFTVSDQLLPYTYNIKKIADDIPNYSNNVGFVVVGLNHTIENNTWTTAVKGNMIFLKDKTVFSGSVTNVSGRVGTLGVNTNNETAVNNYNIGPIDTSKAKFTSSGASGLQNIGYLGLEIGNTIATMLGYIPEYNSIYRSPQKQEDLIKSGYGVKDSFHLTGNAIDVKPEDWKKLTSEQLTFLRNKYDIIYHNNHYHVEPKSI